MDIDSKTQTNRWMDESSYVKNWIERSELLLKMFNQYAVKRDGVRTFAEFGCGFNAPFSQACAKHENYSVKKFDIKQWDEDTTVIDLNKTPVKLDRFDVCVFSGVLEYMNDVPSLLREVMKSCDYILASYAHVPQEKKNLDDSKYIEIIRERSVKHGWRNHYRLEKFVEIISSVGIVSDAGIWRNDQALFMIRNADLDLIEG